MLRVLRENQKGNHLFPRRHRISQVHRRKLRTSPGRRLRRSLEVFGREALAQGFDVTSSRSFLGPRAPKVVRKRNNGE